MRSKWNSQKSELDKERARKLDRLNDRLTNQNDDANQQAELEAELVDAQGVLAHLQGTSADQSLIDAQQTRVDELQAEIDGIGLSTSYVSKTDARIIQMELDELAFSASQRETRIAEIDALLA